MSAENTWSMPTPNSNSFPKADTETTHATDRFDVKGNLDGKDVVLGTVVPIKGVWMYFSAIGVVVELPLATDSATAQIAGRKAAAVIAREIAKDYDISRCMVVAAAGKLTLIELGPIT